MQKAPGSWAFVVARGRIELPTYRFSGGRSYQLSYLAVHPRGADRERWKVYPSGSAVCRQWLASVQAAWS